ncbi:MAG: DUF4926 domain-containing protein [Ignavibacteriae bacterium]|nr:DUF4926 domain-containing protein [Ignavibacteriota bacterium]
MSSNAKPKLLDVVALLRDVPEHNIRRGMVGTIVETQDNLYLVEFCNAEGETLALASTKEDDFLVLERITAQGVDDL